MAINVQINQPRKWWLTWHIYGCYSSEGGKKHMKRCGNKHCPLPQPLKPSQFNKNVQGKDGLQNYCRVCQSMSNAKGRKKYPESAKLRRKRQEILHKDRRKAISRIRYAIKCGKIERLPCEVCGKARSEMFIKEPYDKYAPPWEDAPRIRWYCHGHHPRRASSNNTITYEEFDVEDET